VKTYPKARRRRAHHPRVPAFLPVLQRARSDGWTPERQARFLAELAITRSVTKAARKVGMARETAYRLRAKAGGEHFAAAWEKALGRDGPKPKVTFEERRRRALEGLLQPRIYGGKCTAIAHKADNTALLGHLAALDRFGIDEEPPGERSQSFAPHSQGQVAHSPPAQPSPLPRRAEGPISLSRREYFASKRQGSR
jgi:hypothetical protein